MAGSIVILGDGARSPSHNWVYHRAMKQLLITIVFVLFATPGLWAQEVDPEAPKPLSLEDELSVQKVQNRKLVAQRVVDQLNLQIAILIRQSAIGKKRDAAQEKLNTIEAELQTKGTKLEADYSAKGWQWDIEASQWIKLVAQGGP